MFIVIAGHEINALQRVRFNDTILTTSSADTSNETVFTVTNSAYTNTDNEKEFTKINNKVA